MIESPAETLFDAMIAVILEQETIEYAAVVYGAVKALYVAMLMAERWSRE